MTEYLKLKGRMAITSKDDLKDIEESFTKHVEERHDSLSAEARVEAMRFYSEARRLLSIKKSVHLISYL
jgi:hypothetical protein